MYVAPVRMHTYVCAYIYIYTAQHQLNIDSDRLTELIGRPQVVGLWRMADELLAAQVFK